MKEFWDERYRNPEYVYGEEPNAFFAMQLSKLPAGTILLPADGEGRNAVFAAKCGWNVFAFDQSVQGQIKALKLADKNRVRIDYQVGELSEVNYEKQTFDVIALIYAHFPEQVRATYHQRLTEYLKEDGMIIIEAFSKRHRSFQLINPEAGGPKDLSMLYSVEDIRQDFAGFDIKELIEEDIDLSEGMFHSGKASVIRFVATRKSLKE
jgi:Methyltransferase domain